MFRKLWAATAASNLSDGVTLAAAPLLAATITRDPAMIAGITVAQRAPWLVLAFVSGALADRLDRRKVAQSANWIRAAAFAALTAAVLADTLSMPLLYVVFFAIGTAETLYDSVSAAWVPMLVGPEELTRANSRLQTTWVVCNEFAGPPIGGFLFAAAAAAPFALGTAGYLAAVGLLALIPSAARGKDEPDGGPFTVRSVREDIVAGARWYWSSPVLRALSLVAAAGNAAVAASYGLLVLLAQDELGVSDEGYGLMLAASAIGAVLGGMAAGRVGGWFRPGTLILVTNLLSAAATAGLGLALGPAVTVALMALDGFVVLVVSVHMVTLRQQIVPNELMGRVTSVYRVVAVGSFAVGGIAGGAVAAAFGVPASFYAAGAAIAVTAVAVLPVLSNARLAEVVRQAEAAADPADAGTVAPGTVEAAGAAAGPADAVAAGTAATGQVATGQAGIGSADGGPADAGAVAAGAADVATGGIAPVS
ncbi:MFS transporter [Streptomyces sp. NPDC127112]|uniref:MFS transporter n=1 Tax=Streptomyces sp. NPDC127112 TaxID=3345364 RepID=UPI00362A5E4B